MFSKYMFLILGILVQYGHYTGCLPYEWDFRTNRIRVSKSRISFFLFKISLAYTVTASTVLLISYVIYVRTTGFHIRDLRNTFQFLLVCGIGMICIGQYIVFKRMSTVSHTLNLTLFFFKSIPGRNMERIVYFL